MKMKPISSIKADLGIDPTGPVQKFFVDTCYNHMYKYIPMDTGHLANNVRKTNRLIIFKMPYAHYQYVGISKYGKPFNYSTYRHPLAGSYWDKRMVSAEMQDVIREVQEYVNRGG